VKSPRSPQTIPTRVGALLPADSALADGAFARYFGHWCRGEGDCFTNGATDSSNTNVLHKESAMRQQTINRTVKSNGYRPTCARITGRAHRPVALPSALDAPDPSWLPEPLDEWDRDTDVVSRYASAIERD
jgi:hypothetical protein